MGKDYPDFENTTPLAVDHNLLVTCLGELDYSFRVTNSKQGDRIELTFATYDTLVSFQDGFSRNLTVESTMAGSTDLSRINELAEKVSEWNNGYVRPGAYLNFNGDGAIRLNFFCALSVDRGATQKQIGDFLSDSFGSTARASAFFGESFPELQRPKKTETINFDDNEMVITKQAPEKLTLERIRAGLAELGINEPDQIGDGFVLSLNNVRFSFAVESGQSLEVAGYWDTELDPATMFMRTFLVCNEFNEKHQESKAVCRTIADDILQVYVTHDANCAPGINDEQVIHNLSLGIHRVLTAIEHISQELTGTSVVRWPS